MTPRHTAPPDEQQQALSTAARLAVLLAAQHNIPAEVQTLPCGVVVRVFAGLIPHVDHIIWWTVPDLTRTGDKPLRTYAHTVEAAADRLAQHYRDLRSVPLADLVISGHMTRVAAELFDETEVHRAAAPI